TVCTRDLDYFSAVMFSEFFFFFFSSRRRHTRFDCDWSSDVCSSDLCWFGLYTVTYSSTFLGPLNLVVSMVTSRKPVSRGWRTCEIGRASCREEGRSRWGPDHVKKKN